MCESKSYTNQEGEVLDINTTKRKAGLFINFSNHPSDTWTTPQTSAALAYADQIIDIPFPAVDPTMDERGIYDLADKMTSEIMTMNPAAVLCQGEFGLCFSVVRRLQKAGVQVLYACSERKVRVEGSTKTVQFDFVKFRRYE